MFIAPCVVTTNDNFMGRTEQRKELMKGPTIRRGARIGGGAILCPGVEIGEEAFVGAGAVVTKDVPPRVARRRLAGARAARRRSGRAQGERRLTRERQVVLHGLGRAATRPSPRGSRCRATARGTRAAPGDRPDGSRRAGASAHVEAVDALRARRPELRAAPSRRPPATGARTAAAPSRGGRDRRRGCRPSSRATRRSSAGAAGACAPTARRRRSARTGRAAAAAASR